MQNEQRLFDVKLWELKEDFLPDESIYYVYTYFLKEGGGGGDEEMRNIIHNNNCNHAKRLKEFASLFRFEKFISCA